MFAPRVAKPNAKTAAPSMNASPLHRATPFGHRYNDVGEYLHMVQQSIGNQATLRLLRRQGLSESTPGKAGQDVKPESISAEGGSRGLAWDFSKIPLFPPKRMRGESQSSSQSPAPRLRGPIQTKLKVGTMDDPLKHEADRVVEQVMRMPFPESALTWAAPRVSRKRAQCNEEIELYQKEDPAKAAVGETPAAVHEVLRSPGQPLDPATRGFMGPRFGRDFSGVRVHTDPAAARSARDVNARAYTVGHKVVFGSGQFAPVTNEGQKLLAHELTHVVQQAPDAGTGLSSVAKGLAFLQRSPFGLASAGKPSEFGTTAVRWTKKYPKTTLEDFAVILLEEANARLEKIGVPSVDRGSGSGDNVALFESSSWAISLNLDKAVGHPASARISELEPDKVAELTVSFYHEARHAEQRFLEARLAVSEDASKDAKTIAAEMSIPERVAASAIAAGGRLAPGQRKLARELTEFRDKYLGYKMWIKRMQSSSWKVHDSLPRPSPEEVDSVTRAWTQVQPTVAVWRGETTWADKEIKTVSGLKKRDALDEQVLKDLRSTRKTLQIAFDKADALQVVMTDWARIQNTKTITTDIKKRGQEAFKWKWLELEVALRDVGLALEAAYEQYPEEVDARSTESETDKTVHRQARTGPAARP